MLPGLHVQRIAAAHTLTIPPTMSAGRQKIPTTVPGRRNILVIPLCLFVVNFHTLHVRELAAGCLSDRGEREQDASSVVFRAKKKGTTEITASIVPLTCRPGSCPTRRPTLMLGPWVNPISPLSTIEVWSR